MQFLVLAESYKFDGLCIAGIDYDTKEYVRIGHMHNNECESIHLDEILLNENEYVGLLDVVDITVEKMNPNGCHTEDYNLISFNRIIKSIDIKELEEIYSSMEHKNFIFLNNYYKLKPSEGNTYDKSLILCKVSGFEIDYVLSANGKSKPVASFIYNNRYYSNMTITDMIACGYPFKTGKKTVKGANAFIMISLPNDDWPKEHGYFKYVSGIILIDKEYSDYESDLQSLFK